jgi:2,4-didehydro-3-deoxy-L-rhamnonate hydrolase
MKPPTEPEVFLKGIGFLTGPVDPTSRSLHKGVKQDWETELTVFIGREAKDIYDRRGRTRRRCLR